jgi:hypothetical protein
MAGLPKIRFHDLRHFLATVMFSELRAHHKGVQGMFGHEDVKITPDTYTHYLLSMQGAHVARLDEPFGEWDGGGLDVSSDLCGATVPFNLPETPRSVDDGTFP